MNGNQICSKIVEFPVKAASWKHCCQIAKWRTDTLESFKSITPGDKMWMYGYYIEL